MGNGLLWMMLCLLATQPLVVQLGLSSIKDVLKDVESHWKEFKKTHKLKFGKEEDSMRLKIFHDNAKYISDHNLKGHSFTLGLNRLAHMNEEEYKTLRGYWSDRAQSSRQKVFYKAPASKIVDRDWRKAGIVSPVKNQGRCGSCWAFSATGSMEAYYTKMNKKLVLLSEQDLVDCSNSFGNMGCNGGLFENAFAYVQQNGINSEKRYPYKAQAGTCKHSNSSNVLYTAGFRDLAPDSEEDLSLVLSSEGPVSVAIDASLKSFQLYSSGIYDDHSCSNSSLDHAVLAVGLVIGPPSYYIVKNSWGTNWGDNGYINIARNSENRCGIATQPCIPIIAAKNTDL